MADKEAVRRLIEHAYAARAAGNVDGIMEAFHSDAKFELTGDAKLVEVAGACCGHTDIRKTMTDLCGAFDFLNREYISFLVDGDRAAVHSRVTMRFVPKNLTFTTELVDLFKVQDGKVVELVEFADTALIKHLMSA